MDTKRSTPIPDRRTKPRDVARDADELVAVEELNEAIHDEIVAHVLTEGEHAEHRWPALPRRRTRRVAESEEADVQPPA